MNIKEFVPPAEGLPIGESSKVEAKDPILFIQQSETRIRIIPTKKMWVTTPSGTRYPSESGDRIEWFITGNPERIDFDVPDFVPSSLPKELGMRLAFEGACHRREVFSEMMWDLAVCASEADHFATCEGWAGYAALGWKSDFPKQFAPGVMNRAVKWGWLKPDGRVLNVAGNSNSNETNIGYRSLVIGRGEPKYLSREIARRIFDETHQKRVLREKQITR